MEAAALAAGTTPFDRYRFSRLQFGVALLCGLIVMLDGWDSQAIAYVAPKIADQWGIKPSDFGPIFSAGLVGFAVGSLILGGLADKVGRKPVLLLATLLFGAFALVTPVAHDLNSLLVLRFLTGIGLGAAVPNTIALTSEYAPTRLRATAVMIMICGFPLGSVIGGIVAAPLMETLGWRAVFILGGIGPLVLLPVLAFALPESARFLALKPAASKALTRILQRIDPQASTSEFIAAVQAENAQCTATADRKTSTIPQLFAEGRAATTLLLWLVFFNGLLVYYLLTTWLPTLVRASNLSLNVAIYATAIFNLGGVVGAFVLARLVDRWNPFKVLGWTFVACGVFVALVAFASRSAPLLLTAAALAGFGSSGGQIGSNALSALVYPTAIRSTGVGWAFGIGRAGAITGPLVAGALLGLNWSPQAIILTAVLPALICSGAIFTLGLVRSRHTAGADA